MNKIWILLSIPVMGLILAACAGDAPGVGAVEREQIENVVRQYFIRDRNLPNYEIAVDEVTNDWARVRVKPQGIDTSPSYVFLKKQEHLGGPALAPPLTPQLPVTPTLVATSGWVIVLGPQISFTDAELDAAGVPPDLRPD